MTEKPSVQLPSGIKIRRAKPSDAAAISQVHYEALDRFHDFYAMFFRRHPREIIAKATEKSLRNEKMVFWVAEEGGESRDQDKAGAGDVVGFVRYCVEESKDVKEAEEQKKKEEEEERKKKDGRTEEEKEPSLWECKEELEGVWKELNNQEKDSMMENAANGRKHVLVQHLMIRPSHQRKGIGRALLATALVAADEQGLPSVIVSSAESVNLYKRMGFKSLGAYILDNGRWAREAASKLSGLEKEVEKYDGVLEVEDVMVREPNA